VHSKKIGTVFSAGLIHCFFVMSHVVLRNPSKEVPRKQLMARKIIRTRGKKGSELLHVETHGPHYLDFRPAISVEVSVNLSMKSRLAPLPLPRLARLVLLYTRDADFQDVVRQALSDTGTVLLIAQTAEEALQIVCRRKRELDVAIMAFNEECRGITLLSAIHGCCDQLPTLVVVDKGSEQARALAYANGARLCLIKPVSAVELANAIADLEPAARQLAA
jgi:CheY-like chemotaxis protein